MLLRICGERRADIFDGELFFLKFARNNRIDRHLTLWLSANHIAGARRVPAPSRPESTRVEADAAKTSFLQARKRPVYPFPQVAGKGNPLARGCVSGALPAWPTCRTGGNQL